MVAVYIDKNLDQYNRKIKYTIDFIFSTLGYNFKYISRIPDIKENDIILYYGLVQPSIEEAYVVGYNKVIFFVPFEPELLIPGRLAYDHLAKYMRDIYISAHVPVISKNKITDPINCMNIEELYYGIFHFDIIGNIFFHLVEYENYNTKELDKFGRKYSTETNFYKHMDSPYVNSLLWFLENCLLDAIEGFGSYYLIKKEYWPKGESCAIGLSHNVDKLEKWKIASIVKSFFEDFLYFYNVKYVFNNATSKLKYFLTNIEEYWNFGFIKELEDNNKIKSTYFWGTHSEHHFDVDYKIDEQDVRAEIHDLFNRGNDIGLLASYFSNKSDLHEKQKKEIHALTHSKQIGIRQIKYRYDNRDTPKLHNKNGFYYDSSFALFEKCGFRSGIGFPFYIYSPDRIKHLSDKNPFNENECLEIPLMFSDETLKTSKTRQISLEKARKIIVRLLDAVKKFNGFISLDFSVPNFYDIKYHEKLYDFLIKKIKQQKAYVATLLEIALWWKNRNTVNIKELSPTSFSIFFPNETKSFILTIHGDRKIREVENANYKVENNRLIFSNLKASTFFEIEFENNEPE